MADTGFTITKYVFIAVNAADKRIAHSHAGLRHQGKDVDQGNLHRATSVYQI